MEADGSLCFYKHIYNWTPESSPRKNNITILRKCFVFLFSAFLNFPVSETIQPTATKKKGRWGCRGKDGVNFSDHAVWTAACVWSACVCLFQSQMFWSAGQKVSPPGWPPRRATFSALSGMRAFLVLLQAADSQRSLFGSNSADCSPYVTTKYIVSCQTVIRFQTFSHVASDSSTWVVKTLSRVVRQWKQSGVHAGRTDTEIDVMSVISNLWFKKVF